MIGDKNVNNAKKMREYRVAVNMNVEIAMYKAEIINNYNGLDFCEKANEWFDKGWQYVDYLKIGNANVGFSPVMILNKED